MLLLLQHSLDYDGLRLEELADGMRVETISIRHPSAAREINVLVDSFLATTTRKANTTYTRT